MIVVKNSLDRANEIIRFGDFDPREIPARWRLTAFVDIPNLSIIPTRPVSPSSKGPLLALK